MEGPPPPVLDARAAGLPWDRPEPFVIEIQVRAQHIDHLGHANNLHYLDWLQRCAWSHSAAAGFDGQAMVALGYAMVVRETHLQYLLPTFAGDVLYVGDWLESDLRMRARREFQIIRAADQATVMRAGIDYVCVRLASGRAARMPPEFRAAYGAQVERNGPAPGQPAD